MIKRACVTAGVAAWLFACNASIVMAQGGKDDAGRVGDNVGDLIGGWAKSLYVGIAAIVALLFLLNRRFADMAVFMLAAVIVGGFVLAPNDVAGLVRDIWQTITA